MIEVLERMAMSWMIRGYVNVRNWYTRRAYEYSIRVNMDIGDE